MSAPTARTTAHALGWVTAGSMTANACAYLVHLPASRWFSEAEYGEFAVVLAWLLVVAVPALACQAVIAREAVRGVSDVALRRFGLRLTVLVAVAALLVAPLVSIVADVGLGVVLPGVLIAPMLTLIATGQGILQGRYRFRTLGVVLAITGVLRSAPMVAGVAAGLGVGGALWAGLVGAAIAAGIVWLASRSVVPPGPDAGIPAVWTVVAASQVQLALVVASSLDLLISRTALSETDAGVYAVGAVALKVAFWLPQAVGVVFYPRMADVRHTRQSVRGALVVVSAIGAVLIVAALAGSGVVPLVVGAKYDAVVGVLWLFTYTGVALSLLQVLLLATIAARRTRWSLIAWLVIAVEAVVILLAVDSVTGLITVAAIAATVSTFAYAVTFRFWAPGAERAGPTNRAPGAERAGPIGWAPGAERDDAGDQREYAEQPGDQRDDPAPDGLRP
ncbi:lipopolysaccharide biosynthesis protein [Gordonia sp. CPCC 205333]|uniref:lipopolysaccharide biosynthesis protein n=1 Tax=Gordonia sp. CPCC 205333 TaxID=3140790 RepID=UPI003AF3AE15